MVEFQGVTSITAAIRPYLAGGGRVMLAFRWFGAPLRQAVSIPVFEQEFRYIKTIAISTFQQRDYRPHGTSVRSG